MSSQPGNNSQYTVDGSNERRAFLLKLSDQFRAEPDEKQVGLACVEGLARHLGVARCYITEMSDDFNRGIVGPDYYIEGLQSIAGEHSYEAYPDSVKRFRTGKPYISTNIADDPLLSDVDKLSIGVGLGLGAIAVLSLFKGEGKSIWALTVGSIEPRDWTMDEIQLVQDVAERTWAAIERARADAALRLEDQRKDEFMAMLGHELRNPLAVVANTLLYLELSKGEDPSLPYPTGIQRMSRQVKHLGRMVDDLLEVSRIRQGKIRLQRQLIELGPLVEQAVEAAQSLSQQYERSVELALPTDPIVVNGDATRLAQVVTNLVTNAAKYTDEGGHIWVTLEQQKGQAILHVKDDGIGIPADYLTAIFEVFVQSETSLDRPHGGLGLGLAVVKQIVEGHDGQIQARSDGPGKGSEFVLKLPLVAQEAGPQQLEPDKPQTERGGVRVLLVDDNRELIDLMGKIMQLQGYEVHLRYSGQEGILAAQALAPDVVLLDVGMPYLDGYAVCRHIRQQAWGRHLPIIALTGFGQEADKQRSWAAGFDEHLLKPIDYTSLPEVLTRTIEAKQGS